jgi:hypothetical protein
MANLFSVITEWDVENVTPTYIDDYSAQWESNIEEQYIRYNVKSPSFAGETVKITGTFYADDGLAMLQIKTYSEGDVVTQEIEVSQSDGAFGADTPLSIEVNVPADCTRFRVYFRHGWNADGFDTTTLHLVDACLEIVTDTETDTVSVFS